MGVFIFFFIAVGFFALSFFHFIEKSPPINNAFVSTTEEERKTPDKKPHYRQSVVVFLLLGILLFLLALETFWKTEWLYIIVRAIAAITVVYAIQSSTQ